MGKKGDLSDFERGMFVGARRAGLSISKTAESTGIFKHKHLYGLQRMVRKEKYPVSGSCVGKNALMSE